MAKRMANSAEERKTSNSTRARKKYLTSLRSTLVGLRVSRMARRRNGGAFERRTFLQALFQRKKGFVLVQGIGDNFAHEVHPDGKRGVAAGFVLTQVLLFVKAHPHAAGHAG